MASLETRTKLYTWVFYGNLVLHFLLTILCFGLLACGSHSQTVNVVEPKEKISESGETDLTLRLINGVNSGDLSKVKAAIAEGADLKTLSQDGVPLLIEAIIAEQFAIIDFLIESNIDLNLVSKSETVASGLTALEFLDSEENREMDNLVKTVISRIIKREQFSEKLLSKAVFDAVDVRNVTLVKWILSKGLDPNVIKGRNSLLMSIFKRPENKGSDGFEKIKGLYRVITAAPEIDVNLVVRRKTALKKVESLVKKKKKVHYQYFVDRLKSHGIQ